MQLVIRTIAYFAGVLAVIGIMILALHTFPKGKIAAANLEIRVIQSYINHHQDALLRDNQLSNQDFVKITDIRENLSLSFDEKGQIVDPWGEPYVIGQNDGKITVTSRKLDRFNKLSDFQKLWNYE